MVHEAPRLVDGDPLLHLEMEKRRAIRHVDDPKHLMRHDTDAASAAGRPGGLRQPAQVELSTQPFSLSPLPLPSSSNKFAGKCL